VRVVKVETSAPQGDPVRSEAPLDVTVVLESDARRPALACLGVSSGTATPIFVLRHDVELPAGETELTSSLGRLPLPAGRYSVWPGICAGLDRDLVPWSPAADFDVVGPTLDQTPSGVVRLAPVHVDASWRVGRR